MQTNRKNDESKGHVFRPSAVQPIKMTLTGFIGHTMMDLTDDSCKSSSRDGKGEWMRELAWPEATEDLRCEKREEKRDRVRLIGGN